MTAHAGSPPTVQRVVDAVGRSRLVAIVRAGDVAAAVATGRLLLAGGVRCLEVSLVTPGALHAIETLAAERPDGTFVGAGTVLTEAEVDATADAGGAFVVSPVVDPAVVGRTRQRGLASFPGAATPTEALDAVRAGADAVKLFPASAWDPGVLRDVLAALPWLRTVPTGGLGVADATAWIDAGAFAVGMGSSLAAVAASDPARLAALLADLGRAGTGRSGER